MPDGKNLLKMTIQASTLGIQKDQFPETFELDGKMWTKDHMLVAQQTGEIQYVDYTDGERWLTVYNE